MIIQQYVAELETGLENELKKADPLRRRLETARRIRMNIELTRYSRADDSAYRNISNRAMFDDPVWGILHDDLPEFTEKGQELARKLWYKIMNRTLTEKEYNLVLRRKHPVLYPWYKRPISSFF